MSFVPNTESNKNLGSPWLIVAIGAILVITTSGLYLVAGQRDATWHWLPTITMGYLLAVGLATLCFQIHGGVVTALVSALAIVPLFVHGWQRYPPGTLVSIGTVVLLAFGLVYSLHFLSKHQQQPKWKEH